MNYGYEPTEKDSDLADMLAKMLCAKWPQYPEIKIEVNGMYPGVRLRNITRLTSDEMDKLVEDADAIYDTFITVDSNGRG